jgi:hypothetical protein
MAFQNSTIRCELHAARVLTNATIEKCMATTASLPRARRPKRRERAVLISMEQYQRLKRRDREVLTLAGTDRLDRRRT